MPNAVKAVPTPSAHEHRYLLAQHRNAAAAIADEIRDDGKRKAFAESFCHGVLSTIWDRRVRQSKPDWFLPECEINGKAVDASISQLSAGVATLLARLDPVLSGYFLGNIYTSLLPSSIRSAWGVFYTPPPLVERLLSNITNAGIDWTKARIIDPACGGAAFLAPVAVRVWQALSKRGVPSRAILEHIGSSLTGVEIDPFAAWMSQALTEIRLFDLMTSAGRRLPGIVRKADALSTLASESPSYDLVVGNPPYGKVRLSSMARLEFSRSLYGHPNLYGMFTDLALRISSERGLVGFVTPTSFLSGQYFKALRSLLCSEAPPLSLDFVNQRDGVFEDVLQETVLVVFKKKAPQRGLTKVHTLDAGTSNGGIKVTAVTRCAVAQLGEGPWLVPRNVRQHEILQTALTMTSRLSDYELDVVTGQLVWNRHKDQLRETPNGKTLPLIWAESILPDGSFRFRALRGSHKPFFELRARQQHLVTSFECLLLQRTTAKEQHRRLICGVLTRDFITRNGGGVVVENHLNIIRPREGAANPPPLRAVSALLNSETVDHLFRCISGSVAVSAYELNALPLPDAKHLRALDRLLREGSPTTERTEAYISELYGAAG